MDGRTVAITGATSGIGLAAAAGFAGLGAAVWLAGRDEGRAESARAEVARRTGSDRLHVAVCDLADLASVRSFAERLRRETDRLDVLVHNAGVLPPERQLSPDGIELTFATNVVGPFLLTELLVPLLEASAPAHVITVSSGGMYTARLDVTDLQSERGAFKGTRAYAHAKRAQVVLAEMWAERLQGSRIAVHAMHPGWVDTPGLAASLPAFGSVAGPLLRTPEQGADTIVWLGATAEPDAPTGGFWHDRRRRPTHVWPGTHESAEDRAALWSECRRLARL